MQTYMVALAEQFLMQVLVRKLWGGTFVMTVPPYLTIHLVDEDICRACSAVIW